MRRVLQAVLFGLATLSFLSGCGGGVQKGKNQDFDRPKSVEPTK